MKLYCKNCGRFVRVFLNSLGYICPHCKKRA
jgi:DNA-directed RNA polymerase subunit RPC12/RpoP